MSGIGFRRIRNEDVKSCVKILLGSDPWIRLGTTRAAATKAIREGMRIGEVIVAVKGKEIAGLIVFFVKYGFPLGGYIKLLAVDQKFRGMGIGRGLLRRAEDRIFKHLPNSFLFVSSFNESAQRFYYRSWYVKVGEIPDAIIRGHSELILRKTVGPVEEFKRN